MRLRRHPKTPQRPSHKSYFATTSNSPTQPVVPCSEASHRPRHRFLGLALAVYDINILPIMISHHIPVFSFSLSACVDSLVRTRLCYRSIPLMLRASLHYI